MRQGLLLLLQEFSYSQNIINNKNLYLFEYDLSLEDLVLFTHNFDTFDEYITNYKIYCADKSSSNNDLITSTLSEFNEAESNIINFNNFNRFITCFNSS